MATASRCPNPRCGSSTARFETAYQPASMSGNQLDLVRCATCGTVVGAYDVVELRKVIEKAVVSAISASGVKAART